jgi:hypothetical protein
VGNVRREELYVAVWYASSNAGKLLRCTEFILKLVSGMAKCGIGLAVRLAANGMFQIDDVTPNSPSQMSGFFKKGDLITAVDGKNVIGHTMDQFVQAVLGAPGSDITVTTALFNFVQALLD